MPQLTADGLRAVTQIAERNGVSVEAATALLEALAAGDGTRAQFHHPEFGGMGQWLRGGMTMIGDMFNQDLKYRVDRTCNELAGLLEGQSPFQPAPKGEKNVSLFVAGTGGSGGEWPKNLGHLASSGAQNGLRYAYFPESRRLAIMRNGEVRIYDSGEHRITGFSQAQSGDQTLTFTSQLGVVRLDDLKPVAPQAAPAVDRRDDTSPPPPGEPAPAPSPGGHDIFALIERLAELRSKNILTDEEFAEKKRDLLSRL